MVESADPLDCNFQSELKALQLSLQAAVVSGDQQRIDAAHIALQECENRLFNSLYHWIDDVKSKWTE